MWMSKVFSLECNMSLYHPVKFPSWCFDGTVYTVKILMVCMGHVPVCVFIAMSLATGWRSPDFARCTLAAWMPGDLKGLV